MKNMKKALCILTLALLSLALLAGCGSSGDKLSDPAAIEAYGILIWDNKLIDVCFTHDQEKIYIYYDDGDYALFETVDLPVERFREGDNDWQKQSLLYFKGQWLTCDFGKELAGEVYISECGKKDRKYIKNNIAMDNEQFSKRFCVTASNPQEAFYILTPHMMEYITAMADKSGGAVYMSFLRSGKMHVAVQTGRDFFELGKTNTDTETLRQKFLGELRWFTDIVDTLRVEDTIYKKETTV